jgi:hypothetical protein
MAEWRTGLQFFGWAFEREWPILVATRNVQAFQESLLVSLFHTVRALMNSGVSHGNSWTNLTNMIYVDQPVGTGFSPAAKGAPPKIKNENDVAEDFMGFWKNFIETFDMEGRDVYITGESYAGQ